MSERFLYVHGGPGLNSAAERAALKPLFDARGWQIDFWNEPSVNRGQRSPESQAYTALLSSLGSWLDSHASRASNRLPHLIGHSFAAVPLVELGAGLSHPFASLTLIAPALELKSAHDQIIRYAFDDFRTMQDPRAEPLKEYLSAHLLAGRPFFDASTQRALEIAFTDPALLTHYFTSKTAFENAISALSQPHSAPDLPQFFHVLRELSSRYDGAGGWFADRHQSPGLEQATSSPPLTLIYGEEDMISTHERETPVWRRLWSKIEIEQWPAASHYAHLDQPEKLMQALAKTIQRGYQNAFRATDQSRNPVLSETARRTD